MVSVPSCRSALASRALSREVPTGLVSLLEPAPAIQLVQVKPNPPQEGWINQPPSQSWFTLLPASIASQFHSSHSIPPICLPPISYRVLTGAEGVHQHKTMEWSLTASGMSQPFCSSMSPFTTRKYIILSEHLLWWHNIPLGLGLPGNISSILFS